MTRLPRSVGPPGPPEDGGGEAPLDPRSGAPSPPPPEPEPDLPPHLARFLSRGLILFPLAVAVLWYASDLGVWDALYLVALLELLPVLAVAQVPLAAGQTLNRTSVYLGSSAAILVLGWLALALGRGEVGLAGMGLASVSGDALLLWTGVACGGGLLLVGAFHLVEKWFDVEEPRLLRELLPRSRREKLLFVGVSLSAGFGEELAYRGYAIPVLAGLVGSEWVAAVLSSGIFGFLHAYQGQVGVLRTGFMGLVLAAVFLLSGSLWPAIAGHVIIDLVGGLVVGPRLMDEG